MDHSFLMSRFQPFCDLTAHLQPFFRCQRTPFQSVLQVFTFNKLQHQKRLPVRFRQLMNGSDVRMIERCQKSRLSLKPRQALAVLGKNFGQYLDRYLSA